MSTDKYQLIIEKLPEIAEAVNVFESEAVQVQVVAQILEALKGSADSGFTDFSVGQPLPNIDGQAVGLVNGENGKKVSRKSSGGKSKQALTIDKDLDLVKGGTPGFEEFAESKKPSNNGEKNLVAVYWLINMRKPEAPATLDQVYTCFREVGWRVPEDLRNSLAQAGTKGWLDTRSASDLKVTIGGENHVLHTMNSKIAGAE